MKNFKDSNKKMYAIITGGGISFLNNFTQEGSSKVFLGAQVPYNQDILKSVIGEYDKCVSKDTAIQMAEVAYRTAYNTNPADYMNCIGLGVTCSLKASNEREGREHNVYIAIREYNKTWIKHLRLSDHGFTREREERIVDLNIQQMMIKLIDNTLLSDNEVECIFNTPKMFALDENIVVFSGSFNPLHDAHLEMFNMQSFTDVFSFFEISTSHPDKGEISKQDLLERELTIESKGYPVFFTTASTYKEKTCFYKKELCRFNTEYNKKIFFIVGADTWLRLKNSDKYDGITRDELLAYFKQNNVKFIVFNRDDLLIEDSKWDVIRNSNDVDCTNYSNPISSTQMRGG